MSDLETFRAKAAAWLETMVPTFGRDARKGLAEADDLALGRRYQRRNSTPAMPASTGRPNMAAKASATSKKSPSTPKR